MECFLDVVRPREYKPQVSALFESRLSIEHLDCIRVYSRGLCSRARNWVISLKMSLLSPVLEEFESDRDEVMDILLLYGDEARSSQQNHMTGGQQIRGMHPQGPRPVSVASSDSTSSSNITDSDAAVTDNVLTLARDMINIVGKLYCLADDRYVVNEGMSSIEPLSCRRVESEVVCPLEVVPVSAASDPIGAAKRKLITAEHRLVIANAQARLAEDKLRLVKSQVALAEDRVSMAQDELELERRRAHGSCSSP